MTALGSKFFGKWREIQEDAFCACLLAYGKRPDPNRDNQSVDNYLDELFKWDEDVRVYLHFHLGGSGIESNIMYREYLGWLEREANDGDES